MRQAIKKIILILASITPFATSAMTEKQASNNLVYFTAAIKDSAYCEKNGFKTTSHLSKWEKQNEQTLSKTISTIEQFALQTKNLSKKDATELTNSLYAQIKLNDDKDVAPGRSKIICEKFQQTLQQYESKLSH